MELGWVAKYNWCGVGVGGVDVKEEEPKAGGQRV